MKPGVKLACMTFPYNKYPLERALEGVAKAGFRYVSLGLPHDGKPAFNDGAEGEAERILRLLDKYGLEPVSWISTDALAPQHPIERARKRMDFVKALGVKELLSLGTTSYRRFPSEPISDEDMKPLNDAFAAKYRLVGEEAEKRGLVVTIKPHTGNTATAQVIADTLRTIGSPAVKASYDAGNVRFYEAIDPAEDFPAISSQTVSFIAKDHRGARAEADFPIPGEGDCNFPAMFAELKRVSFSGPVIVERLEGTGGPASAEELDERVAKAKANLELMLEEAGFSV
ncbi:sugar phosphate isomerase/epimerase [Paenibacillus mesophilus]|uniref:sugar phosphate isomerase/epimerase family protein n=1 Tax=Paenibacillus mesophilus TaxID=2582849 RepID=UPI00110F5908|nr:sugar phosphate isomerase/epimerase [Paenibacillus mesophilus]TMV48443.1 sugar phosphate isomerase/epimerase [Paenibacillus mesophilus]